LHSAVYRSHIDRIINCLIGPLVAAVRMRNFARHADLHSIKSASSTADFFLVGVGWGGCSFEIKQTHKFVTLEVITALNINITADCPLR